MMGHAWLKHREALLAVVIILMIGAIGSRAPSFVSPGNLVRCLTIPPSLSSSPSGR
ncbi:L-rhamnose ABC transporter, transmembrane component 2 [Klebsiella variicola]|uniref:L-rhamnose ABC transporter, transmembrane component 2 n=1 Tax=Klebsiella variicola TaxID=244366 RepID=A0A7H4MAL0_KLEVA|nr:L-rhamnose ABC transporter, transmembrane component 2 [Klebsiella variicola]